MQRSTTHRVSRFGALLVSVALFAACGGGGDEEASEASTGSSESSESTESSDSATESESAPASGDEEAAGSTSDDDGADTNEEPSTTAAESSSATSDDTAPEASDSGETIEVDDFDDLPEDCRDAFADFLRQIEPTVSTIDWETATMADFETLGEQIAEQSDAFDDEIATAGCDDYQVGETADSIQAMIDFAEDEAPGTVGYLEFLATFLEEFTGEGGSVGAADVPTDCEGAIAYMEGLIAEHSTMTELQISDMMSVGTVVTAIGTECPPDQSQAFFERDDVTAFLGG